MDQRPSLSVVIPTYRGRASLRLLIDQLVEVLTSEGWGFEVIVVNDASPDDTWQVLLEAVAEHSSLRAIDLLRNHGQAAATMCGLAHAEGDLVATMDDDLQQPPEELPKLLAALLDHPEWDVVVGSWPRDEGLLRNLGSWVHALVHRLAHRTSTSYRHTTFRVLRRPVVESLLDNETRAPLVGQLLRQTTHRIGTVPVEHRRRAHGRSSFRMRTGVRTVATNLFQGTTLPLRALSVLGFAASVLSLLLAAVFLLRWAGGANPPPGWTSSFLAILFFGGATLLGVGLLGEYLSLVLEEVRRPPRWRIRGQVGDRRLVAAPPDGPAGEGRRAHG
jgi:polyisoprenyl-phosphate glycosyltransferase